MKIKYPIAYQYGKNVNRDPYGSAVYRFLERWADLMEQKIKEGYELKDIAKQCEHEADIEGITGFMYGAAVSVLSQVWEHGEQLRVWHNANFNHTGAGVVNPAIITIKG